jgi:hypothetical protein
MLVVVAFVAVLVANGSNLGVGNDTPSNTVTTLINKPSLPGDNSTASTLGGSNARCKDGTYQFVGGGSEKSDDELCKDNGGVEERLP